MRWLEQIVHPPVASVVMGFDREQVRHPLDGFWHAHTESGIPSHSGHDLFFSLFEHRAPQGCVTLSTYLGGMTTRAGPLGCSSHGSLDSPGSWRHLGVQGRPKYVHRRIWPQAIPSIHRGLWNIRERFDAIEKHHPGLFCRSFRNGISLGDSMLSGLDAAERMHQQLQSTQVSKASPWLVNLGSSRFNGHSRCQKISE